MKIKSTDIQEQTDMADFETMIDAHLPARTTVAVKGLPYNVRIEVECIAEFKNGSTINV